MKPSLLPGVARNVRVDIDRERTIDFMGDKARVYATPALLRDIEVACRELLLSTWMRARTRWARGSSWTTPAPR
jgi:predicted thioesterase